MTTTQTLDQMQQLRLTGMHLAYRSQLELPMGQQLEGHDLIGHLLQSEDLHRRNEKTAYYLKPAKLRLPATLEQIDAALRATSPNSNWPALQKDVTCNTERTS